MSLFGLGNFTLNSGATSGYKIDCDALTDEDITALAAMIREVVGPFSAVEGIPRGGLRLAEALKPYTTLGGKDHGLLITDDVLTTGGRMERTKEIHKGTHRIIRGVVLFARGQSPHWVKVLFQLPEALWLQPKHR